MDRKKQKKISTLQLDLKNYSNEKLINSWFSVKFEV